MDTNATTLFLRKHEDRRIRRGHPWIFSNEVDVKRSPLSALRPGQAVEIRSHGGEFIANAYGNPHSLICARVVSRMPGRHLDEALLHERIGRALALRERLFTRPFYRLIFGESDGLPGLVVDRYGDVLVAQMGTAGMEAVREQVLAVLAEMLQPAAVILRNDIASRALEGLPELIETVLGQVSEPVFCEENGVDFEVFPLSGQKTGWYFDHRLNRRRLQDYVAGRRVLDVFSYTGGWGVQAAVAGARAVLCLDSSAQALESARRNAERNGVGPAVATLRADAFEALRSLHADGERFDVVVLDPPAFVRRKKDVASGVEAYRRLNRLAMRLLPADGVVVSASCSTHLHHEKLVEVVGASAHANQRDVQILEQGHQGPDHPVHPALAESAYLKVLFLRLTRGD
jgi:23S rRNA (cytosine1962-C5)-methyltransferase